jgi:MFS family permease
MAPNIAILLAGRSMQGLGGGMLISLSYIAMQKLYPEHLWSRLFGMIAVVFAGGSLLGPLIGGVFVHIGAWRIAFWCFALQAFLLCAMATVLLDSQPPEPKATERFPALPVLVLSAAELTIAQAGIAKRTAESVLLCLVGLGLLYGSARFDRRSSRPLLPRRLLDVRHPLGSGLLMVFTLSVSTNGFWAYGPLLLRIMFGTEPLVSGYIFAGEALAWSLATIAVSSASFSASKMLIRCGVVSVVIGAAGFALRCQWARLLEWSRALCCRRWVRYVLAIHRASDSAFHGRR